MKITPISPKVAANNRKKPDEGLQRVLSRMPTDEEVQEAVKQLHELGKLIDMKV